MEADSRAPRNPEAGVQNREWDENSRSDHFGNGRRGCLREGELGFRLFQGVCSHGGLDMMGMAGGS